MQPSQSKTLSDGLGSPTGQRGASSESGQRERLSERGRKASNSLDSTNKRRSRGRSEEVSPPRELGHKSNRNDGTYVILTDQLTLQIQDPVLGRIKTEGNYLERLNAA